MLAWVACKMNQFGRFKLFHACTLLLALTFLGIKSYEYHDKLIHYEIKLNNGTFADGHFESAIYLNQQTKEELEKRSFCGNAFTVVTAKATNNFALASVTLHGRIVNDETLLYDLRNQGKIEQNEVTIPAADIKSMENYGPWHNTYLAIYFTLTGLHALHILGGSIVIGYIWGPGRRIVEDRTRTLHQPHRSLRPVLAFRGPGLDFPVPRPIFDLKIYERTENRRTARRAACRAIRIARAPGGFQQLRPALHLHFHRHPVCHRLMVWISFLPAHYGWPMKAALILAVACCNAFVVAGFLMHLISEKKMIYTVLAFTVFFVAGLFGLTLYAMKDFPAGTTFH